MVPGWARWGLIPRWWRKPLKEWKATTIKAATPRRPSRTGSRVLDPLPGMGRLESMGDDMNGSARVESVTTVR
jgi:hypothetical protein